MSGGVLLDGERIVSSFPYNADGMVRDRSFLASYREAAAMAKFEAMIDREIAARAPSRAPEAPAPAM